MKKLIFILLLLPCFAFAQIPAVNDTVKVAGQGAAFTPTMSYGFYNGKFVSYIRRGTSSKWDFYPSGEYLRANYASKSFLTLTKDSLVSLYTNQTIAGNKIFLNNITAAYAEFPSMTIKSGGNGLGLENGAIAHFYNVGSSSDYMLQNYAANETDVNAGLRIKQRIGLNTGSVSIIGNNIKDENGLYFLKTGSVPDSTTISATYKQKSDSTGTAGYQTVGNYFPKGDTRYVTQSTPQNISALKTLGNKAHAATFTIYGTSLATKYGYNGTWRYSDAYPYKLTKLLNFQLSLKGGTGNTTLTYTNAIAASPIPAYTPGDMIGFEVGVNDATNADATTYSTVNFIIRVNGLIDAAVAAGYPTNRIYIFSAFYWTLGDPTRANDIVNASASIASTRGVLYFDGYNTYKSRVNDGTFTVAGGLHPTIAEQTVVSTDMQAYLNAYTINSSVEMLNVYDAATVNTLNNTGSANLSGNTTINNVKFNVSQVASGDGVGDLYTRGSDGFLTPIPAVATGAVLRSTGAGSPPDYTTSPSVTRLTATQDIFISGARTGGGYSLQINQSFTPLANNQILSGGLIAPTFTTGTGALTSTFSGTTAAADGTYTAQATINGTATPTTNATYTVVVAGGVVTSATPVVNGVGYNIGDTFTIAATPGITYTVASLGYTGVSRAAYTFANAPITLTSITTPPNPITGQIWNTTGRFKAFGEAGFTRRFLLVNDVTATSNSVPIGNGVDFTITTATGTGAPVLATSPALVSPTVTTQAVTDNSTKAASTANVQSHFLTATATLDFASTLAQTSSELTITVTGAVDGDVVNVGVPNVSNNANSSYTARVSAANTVSVKLNNYSAAAIDPASGTFKVTVFK